MATPCFVTCIGRGLTTLGGTVGRTSIGRERDRYASVRRAHTRGPGSTHWMRRALTIGLGPSRAASTQGQLPDIDGDGR